MSLARRIPYALGVLACAIAFAILLPDATIAQSAGNAFGGMSENSDAPIDIESDTLTVYDEKKLATFKGNVKAVQGTTTLRAAELHVHYIGGANKLTGQTEKAPATARTELQPVSGNEVAGTDKGAQSQIRKIEARGSVVITSAEDQTTTSDWAIYDVSAGQVTVGGNVVLSQDQNVLKGDRLVIDLTTGESRFENTGTTADGSRRIRALFLPKQEDGKPDKAKRKKAAGDDSAQPAQ